MKLLEPIQKPLRSSIFENSHLTLLYPDVKPKTREEVFFRKNGKSIDKVIEFDINTGVKVKTTHYDYFNDKKIRSIDEFDVNSGKKIRTTNYVLYKSIDEYDSKTGKRLRTINFNVKDDTKISSIQEYDTETDKIIKILIYKRDGRTVNIIKNLDVEEGDSFEKYKKNVERKRLTVERTVPTRSYDNIKEMDVETKENIARLIDNLYKNNLKFENIK